jgi:hypothetical protein
LWALSHIDIRDDQIDVAEKRLAHSLAILSEQDDALGVAFVLAEQAIVAQEGANYARSLSLLLEALDIRVAAGDRLGVIICLERVAGAAAGLERHSIAGRLLGATAAQRDALGTPPSPFDQAFIGRLERGCAAALGTERFADTVAQGKVLPPRVAVAEAHHIMDVTSGPATWQDCA